MNEEEKKVIKMLDKFTTEHKFYNIKHSDNLEDNIEIVLKLIEKLQKENEELNKENEHLHREINRRIKLKIENEKIVDTQFISIQKIKDKIEELKQEKGKHGNCLIEMYEDELVNRDIKILQELIEESEEK